MSENDSETNNQSINSDLDDTEKIQTNNDPKIIDQSQDLNQYPKWINNKGEEVKQVFGFNENAELVNARVAMIGFLMLILTELAFGGEPATLKIFGISQKSNLYIIFIPLTHLLFKSYEIKIINWCLICICLGDYLGNNWFTY